MKRKSLYVIIILLAVLISVLLLGILKDQLFEMFGVRKGVKELIKLRTRVDICLLVYDEPSKKIVTSAVLMYEPFTEVIALIDIPPNTLIDGVPLTSMHFSDRKKYISYLKQLTNTENIFYIAVSEDDFYNNIDVMGGIYLDIPRRLAGDDFVVPKTERKIYSSVVKMYLRFINSINTEIAKIEWKRRLFLSVMNSFKNNEYLMSDKFRNFLYGSLKTDLSYESIFEIVRIIQKSSPSDYLYMLMPVNEKIIQRAIFYEIDEDSFKKVIPDPYRDVISIPQQAKAKVRILNGNGVPGIANRVRDQLQNFPVIDVVNVDNADDFNYAETLIYDYKGRMEEASIIQQAIGTGKVIYRHNMDALEDIVVIIGKDYILGETP